MSDPPCPAGQLCFGFGMAIEGSLCAPACAGMECPAAPDGVTAQAMCVLAEEAGREPSSCALVCDPMAMGECPPAMSCKPIPMQAFGLCTAP